MKIFVKSKPNSNKEEVERVDDKNFIVAVNEPAVDGKANKAIVKALAKYLNAPSSKLHINTYKK